MLGRLSHSSGQDFSRSLKLHRCTSFFMSVMHAIVIVTGINVFVTPDIQMRSRDSEGFKEKGGFAEQVPWADL